MSKEQNYACRYVVWNDLCQSVDSGEDDKGWPSYDAAQVACIDGADMPAFHGSRGLVFGRTACAKAESEMLRANAQNAADSIRRSTVVASIAAHTPAVTPAKSSRKDILMRMLSANEAALAACKRTDKAEIARLRENCTRLRGDLGIKTPEDKLLSAIFG